MSRLRRELRLLQLLPQEGRQGRRRRVEIMVQLAGYLFLEHLSLHCLEWSLFFENFIDRKRGRPSARD